MKRFLTVLGSGVLIWSAPAVVFAGPPQTFGELVSFLIGYINIIVPIIIAAAVAIYMKNTATGIFSLRKGSPDPDWQQSMLWGVLTIFLMVSLWGILSILANTFQIPLSR